MGEPTLVLLVSNLTTRGISARAQMSQVMLLCKPDTLLTWQRELVHRK